MKHETNEVMKKILAIDDRKNNLFALKEMINSLMPDCNLLTAQSGREGIDIAKTEQPDTILLDIVMPEMDGYEVCRRLKEDELTKYIPVIMITAIKTDTECRVEGLDVGADAFLSKPFDSTELTAQINVMLRIKQAEDKLRLEKSDLEKAVLEKTKRLNRVNEELLLEISERNKIEEILHESEKRLKDITFSMADWIWEVDERGYYTYCSKKGQDIMGYSTKEILGKTPFDFMAPDEARKIGEIFSEIAANKKPIKDLENWNIRKDGEEICLLTNGVPILDKEGNLKGYRGVDKDITKRKHAEKIQKVIYNISNAVITTDNLKKLLILIQKELGRIIDTTNFYIALYDSKTDTISLPFFVDEKNKLTSFPAGKTLTYYVIKTQKSLLATKERISKLEKSGDVEIFGSDSEIWLGVPLKIEGEVTGVLAVQSYINKNAFDESDMEILEFVSYQVGISIERKKAEQDLKTALKKATESDHLKSAFLNAMSHELRTPLNAIIGFSELINKDTSIKDILNYSKTINYSGNHLLSIVEDIFDVSMIQSGDLEIHNEKFKIAGFFENIRTILKNEQNKQNKQNLVIRFKPCENYKELLVCTDYQKLKQILIHLLNNALKFTHEGYIEYGFSIENINDESLLKFFVKDTGIGISNENQKLIFDIFRQADDSDTRKYDGVGIGLSIAKRFTEFLGGDIWLESDEGKGSKFYFTIPYIENIVNENINKSTEIININDFSDKTVLIVEDVESVFQYLEVILKEFNIQILWVKDGSEAIRVCSDNSDIDIVFMDIKMPGISGYEATRQIKKVCPDLPIIAQTAYALVGDDKKAEEAGCDDYITKPFKKQILFNIINKYLAM